MQSTPSRHGRGGVAVVRYNSAGGGGDSQPQPRAVSYGGNGMLYQFPQTPTPLPMRSQRQKRNSEAGFRPRIVELDPETDRTLQATPAARDEPSTALRRSSVQSRISVTSSVPSFSPGGVITSTRLETPGQRRVSSIGQFVKPRNTRQRPAKRVAPAGTAGTSHPPTETGGGAAQADTGASGTNWATPVTRRPAASSTSSAASTPESPSAQSRSTSAKQNTSVRSSRGSQSRGRMSNSATRQSRGRSATSAAAKPQSPQIERSTGRDRSRSTVSSANRSQSRSANLSATSSQSRSAGRGAGRAQKTPPGTGGRGRGRDRGARSTGRGAAARSRSPIHRPEEESDHSDPEREQAEEGGSEVSAESEPEAAEVEVSGGESASEQDEIDLDDSHDQTFRPSEEDQRLLSTRRCRPSESVSHARHSEMTRSRRGRPSAVERSGRGRRSSAAAETSRGPNKSAGKASRLSRRSDHPALDDPSARRSGSRGRGRSSAGERRAATLRCPLTVQVAGRNRTVAANNREDLLETVEDLIEAARSRPLQYHADIGRFTWSLNQCVIDLMALKKAGRQGSTKMLTAVKRVRTAAEDLLQPHKVDLVNLYNEAHKADTKLRREEAVRAFLFQEEEDE